MIDHDANISANTYRTVSEVRQCQQTILVEQTGKHLPVFTPGLKALILLQMDVQGLIQYTSDPR